MARVWFSLIVLLGATAFAPAPFPRPERRRDSDSVSAAALQGDWKVVSFDAVGPDRRLTPLGQWFQGVRIRGDRWTYLVDGNERDSFRVVIHAGRPAAIDFYLAQEKPYMIGLLRRQGGRVHVLYYWMPVQRARSFEDMPQRWWLLVLERR